jgi:molecular chaperone GrpE
MRVVDRRWWARKEGDESAEESGVRKPTYVEDLERRLAEAGAKLQTYAAEHRRSIDEFEQVKTRIRRDVAREVERGRRAVLVELLDVVDNLDRAIVAARTGGPGDPVNPALESLTRGVELVREHFLAKLTSFGVIRLDVLGEPFDASRHEAVTTTVVADPANDGLIVAVVKEGYAIGEEILRPASVVVGRHQSEGEG